MKGYTFYNRGEKCRPPVILTGGVSRDGAHDRLVGRLYAAAQRIGKQLFGNGLDELIAMRGEQQLLEAGGSGEFGAVGKLAGGIDRIAGATQLQVTAGEPGFDESVLERVQATAGVRVAVPVIEAVASSGIEGQGNLLILGVDMLGSPGTAMAVNAEA